MEIVVDLFNQHSGNQEDLKKLSLSAWMNGANVVKIQLLIANLPGGMMAESIWK